MTHFIKMHSLGNDFVIVDATETGFSLTQRSIAKLGDRHRGIGFDQLLVLEQASADHVDYAYRVFNADGSEVEQCGNGVRCLARFVWDKKGFTSSTLRLAAAFEVVLAERLSQQEVRLTLGAPKIKSENHTLTLGHVTHHLGIVSLGNPHAVVYVNNVADQPVDSLGRAISMHTDFPAQTNVEFMEVVDRGTIHLRIFERGVGETLACGTGACASVVMGHLWNLLEEDVKVIMPGGDVGVCYRPKEPYLALTGSAEFVFWGEFM